MELRHKHLNYLFSVLIFALLVLVVWGISILSFSFKKDIYQDSLHAFIKGSNELTSRFPNLDSVEIEKDYTTLSVITFKINSGNAYFFLVPVFTKIGLDTAVLSSNSLSSNAIYYLGLLSGESDEKVTNAAILIATEKVEKVLIGGNK